MRFGTDGVRGRANTELTAEFALRLGRAAAHELDASVAVVGGDSRLSTPMLEAAFVAGLASAGVEVHRLGVTPTPAVAYEASRIGAMAAVISASHNPYHDNGIKLFATGGRKLPDEVERRIEQRLGNLPTAKGDPGAIHGRAHADDAYVEHLLTMTGGATLDGLKIVVDAANGAASHLAARVFESAGAETVVINDQPDGLNINAACGATHTAPLQRAVVAEHADMGIALDGDADRAIAVDENGDVVDGDHIIALCAVDLRDRGALRDDTVVVTVMANLGFRLAMSEAGINVVETSVGDRYVLEALLSGHYSLGGEQSGHVIFTDRSPNGDGLQTGLALADLVRRAGRPVSALASEVMTQLPQVLLNIEVGHRRADIAEAIADEVEAAAAPLGDRGRILIRPSGTEPLVRIMVEAPTHDLALATAEQLVEPVRAACA